MTVGTIGAIGLISLALLLGQLVFAWTEIASHSGLIGFVGLLGQRLREPVIAFKVIIALVWE